MTTNNLFKAAVATAAFLLSGPAAEATLMRAVPFDEKVEKSAAILVGKCLKTESRWDAAKSRIYTYSTFKVEKAIKGGQRASEEVVLVTPGGNVDGVYQDAVGVPSFAEGEDSVVFVRNSNEGPTVAYLEQGAYDIVQQGNERVVTPVATEAVHIDTQRGVAVAGESARPLRSFEGEVRAAEKRVLQRMQVVEQEKRDQASLWGAVKRNYLLVALALAGAALATWQLLRK